VGVGVRESKTKNRGTCPGLDDIGSEKREKAEDEKRPIAVPRSIKKKELRRRKAERSEPRGR